MVGFELNLWQLWALNILVRLPASSSSCVLLRLSRAPVILLTVLLRFRINCCFHFVKNLSFIKCLLQVFIRLLVNWDAAVEA